MYIAIYLYILLYVYVYKYRYIYIYVHVATKESHRQKHRGSWDFNAIPALKVNCAMVMFSNAATRAAARVWINWRELEVDLPQRVSEVRGCGSVHSMPLVYHH